MGIFKNITKTLKQAAPVIGSAIGMYIGGPAGYAALGGALGGGIGSLVGGGDTDDALTAALLGGIGGYAAQGSFTGANLPSGKVPVGKTAVPSYGGGTMVDSVPVTKTGSFLTSPTGIATLGLGAAALGGLSEEEKPTIGSKRPDPVGRSRLGIGLVGDKSYNLDDEDERNEYFEDLRKQQGVTPTKFVRANEGGIAEMDRIIQDPNDTRNFAEKMSYNQLRHNVRAGKKGYTEAELGMVRSELAKREAPKISMPSRMPPMIMRDPVDLMRTFMSGGEVEGPGTGTSDSVPARLSDGEFVLTAKSVRGAGGGDRDLGAARMYDMMSKLERVA